MEDEALLNAVRRRVAVLAAADLRTIDARRNYHLHRDVKDAKEGIIRLDFAAWIGREPSGAERKALQRLVHRLAAAGRLQVLTGETGRMTHVRLVNAEGK